MTTMTMRSDHHGSEVRNGVGVISAAVLLFAVLVSIPGAAAQNGGQGNTEDNQYRDVKLTPSMAIIVVVLIAAMFFMGFFSVYVRHCADGGGGGGGGGSIRAMVGAGRSRRSRGLEAEALQAMPTFAYAEVKGLKIGKGALECAVCLNEFGDEETLRLLPKCDHVFHAECIDAWLASHTTCPVCRSNLAAAIDETSVAAAADEASAAEERPEATDQPSDVTVQVGEAREESDDQTTQLRPPRPPPPPRTWSMKRPRFLSMFPRSHSTGHSLVHPGENCDRFTLRLPENVRKDLMKRSLSRASTFVLPRETSSRQGYRTGGDGSSQGKFHRRVERLELSAKSDRWPFLMAPPFFSRALSSKSPKVSADDAGTSAATPAVNAPLNCMGTKGHGAGAASPESEAARLPV